MDTFAVRLATPVKQPSASILNNKGEGGQFIHEAEDFVVFLPVVYKSREKIDIGCILARGSLLFAKNRRGFRATRFHQDLISLPASRLHHRSAAHY